MLSVREYPRSDTAVIKVSTVTLGANPDLVADHHDAARARDRERGWHRRCRVVQRARRVHDHGDLNLNYDTDAELDANPGPEVAQVRKIAAVGRAPIIELETVDTEFAAMYIGFRSGP